MKKTRVNRKVLKVDSPKIKQRSLYKDELTDQFAINYLIEGCKIIIDGMTSIMIKNVLSDNITQMISVVAHQIVLMVAHYMIPFVALQMIPTICGKC